MSLITNRRYGRHGKSWAPPMGGRGPDGNPKTWPAAPAAPPVEPEKDNQGPEQGRPSKGEEGAPERGQASDEKMKTHLSDRFSEAIRQALQALKEREKDSRYQIDMDLWHSPHAGDSGLCAICLAGAVMSRWVDVDQEAFPVDFEDWEKLTALSSLCFWATNRAAESWADATRGDWKPILVALNDDSLKPPGDYCEDREVFYQDMEAYATALEKAGL